MQRVLRRLSDNGVKLNKEKCCFHQEEVEFLGYTWSCKGVKVSEKAVQDLLQAEFPADRSALRSFLGLATYVCSSNVPHASQLLQPLWHLLSQDTWTINGELFHNLSKCESTMLLLRPVADKELEPWSAVAVDITGPSEATDGKRYLRSVTCSPGSLLLPSSQRYVEKYHHSPVTFVLYVWDASSSYL